MRKGNFYIFKKNQRKSLFLTFAYFSILTKNVAYKSSKPMDIFFKQ